VTRSSLDAFAEGRSKRVQTEFFGLSDGLRSAQCAPSYPSGGGGAVTSDGWLWFPTARGLALLNPAAPAPPPHCLLYTSTHTSVSMSFNSYRGILGGRPSLI